MPFIKYQEAVFKNCLNSYYYLLRYICIHTNISYINWFRNYAKRFCIQIFRLCNRAKYLWIWNWNTSCWFLDVVCSGTVLPQLLLLHIFWKQSIYWIRTLGVFFLTLNKLYHTENHGYIIDRVIPPFFLFLINDLTGFKKYNFLWR